MRDASADGESPYCTFRLAGRLFGVDVRAVREVNTRTAVTPVPLAPPAVVGLVNLRGQPHLILDLCRLLRLGESTVTPESRLVIFKPAVGEAFGVLVDAIGDVVRLGPAQVERYADDDPDRAGGLLVGVGQTESTLLALLDPSRLLETVNAPAAQLRGAS